MSQGNDGSGSGHEAGGTNLRSAGSCFLQAFPISFSSPKRKGDKMPETLTQAQLLNDTRETMEEHLRIDKKQMKDLVESLQSVVEQAMSDGRKINLFGLVTLTPAFVLAKPKRKGTDRTTGEEKMLDAVPAKLKVKATVGKRVKESLPSTTSKVGKQLKEEAEERKATYAKRQAEREAEAAKAEKKAKKSGGKKK